MYFLDWERVVDRGIQYIGVVSVFSNHWWATCINCCWLTFLGVLKGAFYEWIMFSCYNTIQKIKFTSVLRKFPSIVILSCPHRDSLVSLLYMYTNTHMCVHIYKASVLFWCFCLNNWNKITFLQLTLSWHVVADE